jgi:hypothetical protein
MLLRKCIKELGSRTTIYIDQCVKMEREYDQQVCGSGEVAVAVAGRRAACTRCLAHAAPIVRPPLARAARRARMPLPLVEAA